MAAVEMIFPTSRYARSGELYGVNITQYNTAPNTTGFPLGAGLQLGMFGLLFDGTVLRLLKASAAIANNDACKVASGNSNDYTVTKVAAAVNEIVHSVSDRYGAALVADDIAWFTTKGIATVTVAGSITAPLPLANDSTTAGRLHTAVAGTDFQTNILLLDDTSSAGAYAVLIS